MAKTYALKIITPDGAMYEGPVTSAVVPGEAGYFGVLANHAPLATTCAPGNLRFRDASGIEHEYRVGEGFFEVIHNRATLLTETFSETSQAHG
ncbi:MAG: F0F1 ATP synthase subunit epsilon [Candidatus Omnitrophica bacterium]|nr:F0F1 ATP synthase subunit epsilon [Candidatus Omnitrophota bacterium]